MTSRTTEIQTLIADIDGLLTNKNNLLSRLISTQGQEAKVVLERIRDFLARLESTEAQTDNLDRQYSSPEPRSPLLVQFADRERHPGEKPLSQSPEVSALLQPLQTELQMLLQERANLIQEIRQLEQKRLHNYSVAQQMENQEQMISEFLQVLMNRVEGRLPPESSNNNSQLSSGESPLETAAQVEHLSRLANDLDRRLAALDGTVNFVFEGLQRNIYTYHESLSQAIARMHSKGIEGEQLLTILIKNLTGLLQQKRSASRSKLDVQPETLPISPSLSTTGEDQSAVDLVSNIDRNVPSRGFEYSSTGEYQQTNFELEDGKLAEELSLQEPAIAIPDLGLDHNNTVSDRVDQLYASLFGNEEENLGEIPNPAQPESPETNADDLPDISPNSPAQSTQDEAAPLSPPLDPTELTTINVNNLVSEEVNQQNQPQTRDNTRTDDIPEPSPTEDLWFDSPDGGLLSHSPIHSAIPQELLEINNTSEYSDNTVDKLPIDTKINIDSPQPLPEPTTEDVPSPASESTITSLTDLFVDTATGEDSEIDGTNQDLTQDRDADNSTVANIAGPLIADTESGYLEKSLDDYVLASPQENLLVEPGQQDEPMPEISLDEEHLQQLAQDLNQFDGELTSQAQFDKDVEPKSVADSTTEFPPTPQESQVVADATTEFPPTPQESQVVTDAKEVENTTDMKLSPSPDMAAAGLTNNQATTDSPANSPLSVFNPVNTPDISISNHDRVWYLGIDLGSTGISAALLNRSTTEVYPIYWSAEEHSDPNSPGSSFRLPAEVYLPANTIEKQSDLAQHGATEGLGTPPESLQNLFSAQLKPYLQVALPYKNQQQKWEPSLELNEYSTVPLIWIMRSLAKLLLTLKSDRTSTTPGLVAAAVGITEPKFHQIINNIAGVICNCPANSSEQYRFNLREALITGKIVQHPQQVFFVEEAIADLLMQLDGANGERVKFNLPTTVSSEHHPLEGNTLIINIGAGATEMALVDVPNDLLDLAHNDFMLHSFAYAGKGIEQDIICQLLLPEKWQESRLTPPESPKTISSDPWHWQPSIPGLEQMRWHSLRLTELKLPRPGEPDIPERIRLQQRLESSLLGKAVLDAAVALKLILQHQESFTLELADRRWTLQRRDLESQVFVPFVRRLNRELNKLLVARGIPTEAINQAILTGGVASITAVNRWLRQKLPNAKIIQDPYLGENGSPTCSRTAYGLALLPLHPQVLDIPRQQYTDYFLFTELLRLLPDKAVSLSEIIKLFEGRGINTRICQQRLLAFLEGELPPGLLPSTIDYHWLAQSSQENSFYKQLAAAPLFEKQGSLTYRPNSQQIKSLLTYLDAIKGSTQQSLEEPYTVNFALGVSV